MKGASGTGISLINIANGMLHPKNPFIGPFQINVLRRQEIDYQIYFILSIASLTPPKTKKQKIKRKRKSGVCL